MAEQAAAVAAAAKEKEDAGARAAAREAAADAAAAAATAPPSAPAPVPGGSLQFHSDMLLVGGKPGLFHCNYCMRDISNTIRIKCTWAEREGGREGGERRSGGSDRRRKGMLTGLRSAGIHVCAYVSCILFFFFSSMIERHLISSHSLSLPPSLPPSLPFHATTHRRHLPGLGFVCGLLWRGRGAGEAQE